LDSAIAVAEETRRIIDEHHGKPPWAHQVVDMVMEAVDRAVHTFSQSHVGDSNARSFEQGGAYTTPARTREELLDEPAVKREVDEWARGQGAKQTEDGEWLL
jgi:hypothetical protein